MAIIPNAAGGSYRDDEDRGARAVFGSIRERQAPAPAPTVQPDRPAAPAPLDRNATARSVFSQMREREVDVRAGLPEDVKADPDAAARARKAARFTGVSPLAIERNMPAFELEQKVGAIDSAMRDSPRLRGWFARSGAARVSHDDVPALKAVASTYDNAEAGGWLSWMGDQLSYLVTTRVGTDGIRADAAQQRAGEFADDAAANEGFFDRMGSLLERGNAAIEEGLLNSLAQTTGSPRARRAAEIINRGVVTQEIAGSTTWNDVKENPYSPGTIGGYVLDAGVESLPYMAVAAVPYVGLATVATAQSGNIAAERSVNDGGTRGDANIWDFITAAPYGTASAFLDRVGIEAIFAGAGRSAGRRIGGAAAGEGVTEFAQSNIEYAGGTIGTREGFDWRESLEQGFAGALAGAPMGAALRSGQEIAQVATVRVMEYSQARASERLVDDIFKGAANSKLRLRDPELFAEFMAAQAQGTAAENLYVSGDTLRSLFQDENGIEIQREGSIDFEEMVPDFWDQLAQADRTGGDVVIPMARAAAYLAGTPEWEIIKGDARVAPGGLSPNEARGLEADWSDVIEDMGRRAYADARAEVEAEGPRARVYNEVLSQARQAGFTLNASRAYADLWAERYQARADRLGGGANAWQLFEESVAGIRQAMPGSVDTYRRGDSIDVLINAMRNSAQDMKPAGEPLLDRLIRGGGVVDAGGDIRSMGGDKVRKGGYFGRPLETLIREVDTTGDMLGGGRNADFSLDDWALMLWEEGYFGPREDRPTVNELLDLIGDALRGEVVVPFDDSAAPMIEANNAIVSAADDLRRILEDAGLDPETASRAEIDGALDAYQSSEQGTRGFEQEDMPLTIEIDGIQRPTENSRGEPIGTNEAVVRAFWAWFGDSQAVDDQGRPLVVYHGTQAAPFDAFRMEGSEAGAQYFTVNPDHAAYFAGFGSGRSGGRVIEAFVAIRNPLRITQADLENMLTDDDVDNGVLPRDYVEDVVQRARDEGFDGVIIDGFADVGMENTVLLPVLPFQIKSVDNGGTYNPDDARILFQGDVIQSTSDGKPLVTVHNLSADNLRNAEEIGGLAAPSLAIVRADIGFDNFGEITLIAKPDMIDPRKGRGARAFNADVYSPRQPRAQFDLYAPTLKKLREDLQPIAKELGESFDSEFDTDKLAREGLSAIEGSAVARLAFLRSIGQNVRPVRDEKPTADPRLVKFAKGKGVNSWQDVMLKPGFEAAAVEVELEIEAATDAEMAERSPEVQRRIRMRTFEFDDAGEIVGLTDYALRENAKRAFGATQPAPINRYATRQAIEKRLQKTRKREGEFRRWVQDNYAGMIYGRYFEARDSGRRRDYTMANLVREMTRTIRDGEGYNYGIGSLRSNVAKQFRSLAEIKADRDAIIPSDQMDKIKEEATDELMGLVDKLRPYHRSGSDFGFADIVTEFLKDLAAGRTREWQETIFEEPLPDALLKESRDLLSKLRDLPTEYFEVKMQREVGLDEFAAAVVPSDLDSDTLARLRSYGLAIETYERGGPRSEAIMKAASAPATRALFQSAFHGSPFTFDRFSTDFMSRGEGVQAFGWGLYFTNAREIGEHYRNVLSSANDGNFRVADTGDIFNPSDLQHINARVIARKNGIDTAATIRQVRILLADANETTRPMLEEDLARLGELEERGGLRPPGEGRLYEVEIPEDNEFLLWDQPLNAQPEIWDKVVDAADAISDDAGGAELRALFEAGEITGEEAYKFLAATFALGYVPDGVRRYTLRQDGAREASEILLAAGIVGNKYQAGQLSDSTPSGAFNYVVFDAGRVEIRSMNQSAAGALPDTMDIGGIQRPTMNSEGQPLARDEAGVMAFWAWFGDSRVVDDQGRPLVVLHRTDADFEAFDTADFGSWFAEREETAMKYGDRGEGEPRMIRAYVRASNPLIIPEEIDLSEMSSVGASLEAINAANGVEIQPDRNFPADYEGNAFEWIGMDPFMVEAAKANGFDGMMAMEEGEPTWNVFAPEQVKAVDNVGTFNPADPRMLNQEGARGRIDFLADNRAMITLFEGRDMSTLLHEGGHLWLEELRQDARKLRSGSVFADWETTKAWMQRETGLKIRDDREIPTEAHELWARAMERYFMEGKAPSVGLRSAFASFRAWLVRIYKKVAGLNANIDDEVRQVFDRLIATDDAIRFAQSESGDRALFADAAAAGMTEAEFKAYQDLVSESRTEAYDTLLRKTMERVRIERTKEAKDRRANIRLEVEREIRERPEWRAIDLMRGNGDTYMPISRESVIERVGRDAIDMLPKGRPGRPTITDTGLDADLVAERAGFATGHEMLTVLMGIGLRRAELIAAKDRRSVLDEAIDVETDRRMTERYGDILADGTIEEEALEIIHTNAGSARLAAEVRQLAKQAGEAPTPEDAIRSWAERIVGEARIVDHASGAAVDRHRRAAVKAGRAAEQAYLNGDFNEAFRQKQRQQIANALFIASRTARDRVDVIGRRLDRYAKSRGYKGMAPEYLDRIHELLEQFDLRKRSEVSLRERETFDKWAARQRDMGVEVQVPERLTLAGDKHFTRLTFDEVVALDDAVESLANLGRQKMRLKLDKEERDLEEMVGQAVQTAAALPLGKFDAQRNPSRNFPREINSALVKMEFIADYLDDFDPNGVFNEMLVKGATRAANRLEELQRDVMDPLARLYLDMPGKEKRRFAERIAVPEFVSVNPETFERTPTVFLRSELIAVALNVGNKSNFEKMIQGETMALQALLGERGAAPHAWTEAKVMAVLNRHLSESDWQFVETVWQRVNSLWPAIVENERELTGMTPEKVEGRPVETRFGTIEGGYYPLVYDPNRSQIAANNADQEAAEMFGAIGRHVGTPKGHTISRTTAALPITFSLERVLFSHVKKVSTRIAYGRYVRDVMKFSGHPKIRKIFADTIGMEYHGQIKPWLKEQIQDASMDLKHLAALDRILRQFRVNMTLVGLGFRFTTMLAQVAGWANSAAEIGTPWLLRGVKEMARNGGSIRSYVFEKSPEMAGRAQAFDRDIRLFYQQANDSGRREGIGWMDKAANAADAAGIRKIQAAAFWGIGMIDVYMVAMPTWLGAYHKALDGGMSEAEAIDAGDKAVRKSQSAGRSKDLAAVQRGPEGIRVLTTFYSYFNVLYNKQFETASLIKRGNESGRRGDKAGKYAHWRQAAMNTWWIMMIAPMAGALLTGDWPDEEEQDLEGWTAWAMARIFFGLWAGVPGIRDVASGAQRQLEGGYVGAVQSPFFNAFDAAERPLKDLFKVLQGDEPSERWIKNAIVAPGYFIGLPTGQLGTTAQYLADVAEGDQKPEDAGDILKGVIKGPQENQE